MTAPPPAVLGGTVSGTAQDPSVLANWIGITLVGISLAWLPGSARASARMRAALFGTDDEVARLKYRVLRGRFVELSSEMVARGRHLARVTYFGSVAGVSTIVPLSLAVVVMRIPDFLDGPADTATTLSGLLGVVLIVFAPAALVHAVRRRRNARRFLAETSEAPGFR